MLQALPPRAAPEASLSPSAQSTPVSTLLAVAWGPSHAVPLPELSHCLVPLLLHNAARLSPPPGSTYDLRGWVRCHPWAALVPASSQSGAIPLGHESLTILGPQCMALEVPSAPRAG